MAALACLALLPHAVMKPYAESMVPSSLGGEATPSMEQRIQQEKAKIHELTALYRSRRASAAVPAAAPASRVARPSRGLRFAARAVALDAMEGSRRGIVLESFDPAVCRDLPDFRDAKGESCDRWAGIACSSATGDSCGYSAEHVAAVWGACRASCGQCSSVSASSSKKMRRLAKLAVHLEQYEGSDSAAPTEAAQQEQEQPATLALGPQDGLVKLLSWNTTEDDELTLYASTGDKGTFGRVKVTINGETELVVTNSNSTPSADFGSMMAELHGVTMDGDIINKLTQLKMHAQETIKEDGTPAAAVSLVKYEKKLEAKAATETITIDIGGTPLVLNSEWPLLEDEAVQVSTPCPSPSIPFPRLPHAHTHTHACTYAHEHTHSHTHTHLPLPLPHPFPTPPQDHPKLTLAPLPPAASQRARGHQLPRGLATACQWPLRRARWAGAHDRPDAPPRPRPRAGDRPRGGDRGGELSGEEVPQQRGAGAGCRRHR